MSLKPWTFASAQISLIILQSYNYGAFRTKVTAEIYNSNGSKRVALRLCADETSKDYGAISLTVRYFCNPRLLFYVSSQQFLPAPKVDSAVIRLDVLDKPAVNPADEKLLFKIIKASFSQRRKTLANSLSNMTGYDKKFIEQCLTQMGKNVNIRGEQLSLQDYCMLSNKLLQNIQKSCFNS
jgi:16S rRNA (adenine1518-N6/adenine1519-N6)-dimethyltransferase